MSSTTPNIGLTKVTSSETIGDLQTAMNGSGGNMDIIDTKMGPVGGTSLQAQVNALSSQLAKAYTNITEFYDDRCENIGSGESTVIFKTGNVYICSIAVNFLKTPSTSQTSIITLPSGIPSPSSQTWGVVYNRTTGNVHTCAVSTSGNINVINRGLISTGDKVEGQIVWIA